MTALDRQFVRLRFVALAIPFGLLLWLPSASVPITVVLAGLLGACNGVAALAIQKKAVPRFARPMAVLLLYPVTWWGAGGSCWSLRPWSAFLTCLTRRWRAG